MTQDSSWKGSLTPFSMSLISREVVLASGSSARKAILEEAGVIFTVVVSNVDEDLHPHDEPENYVRTLAARFDDFTEREITEDYIQNLIHAFVGFTMPAENIDAKFKLSQNRSMRDRELTAENLRLRAEKHDVAVAEWMERFIGQDRD